MAYPNPSSYVPLVIGTTDGPTLTALASASCIPVASRIQLPAGYWTIAKAWKGLVTGRVSCAATTPGTFRLDLRLGAAGSVVVFDSGPLNLNVLAKTSVPFRFEFDLSCRSVGNGTGTTLWGLGNFESEALVDELVTPHVLERVSGAALRRSADPGGAYGK